MTRPIPAGTSLNDLFLVKYVCVDDILKPPYNFKGTDEQNESGFPAWMFKDEVSVFNLRKPTLIQFNFTFYPRFCRTKTVFTVLRLPIRISRVKC